jgi:membrane protein
MHTADSNHETTNEDRQSWIARITAVFLETRPMRVVTRYAEQRGPLLAAGLAYQAVFAIFAAVWVAFSVAGLFIRSNLELQNTVFAALDATVPGLVSDGTGGGVISRTDLLSVGVLGWTGAIALIGLMLTAVGWLGSGRDAVRAMFLLGPHPANFFLLKLRDLGFSLAFGVALLLSTALSVASTAALSWLFGLIGVPNAATGETAVATALGLSITFIFDAFVLSLFYRFASGVTIPRSALITGATIAAAALGALKVAGSTLIDSAIRNPLLASFAAIIGILVWFYFVSQVIVFAASWIAVGMADRNIPADPRAHTAALAAQHARDEVFRAEIITELALEHAREHSTKKSGWLSRLRGR